MSSMVVSWANMSYIKPCLSAPLATFMVSMFKKSNTPNMMDKPPAITALRSSFKPSKRNLSVCLARSNSSRNHNRPSLLMVSAGLPYCSSTSAIAPTVPDAP